MRAGRPGAAACLAALFLAAVPAPADSGFGLSPGDLSAETGRFRLEGVELRAPGPLGPASAAAETRLQLRPPPKLWDGKTLRLTTAVVLAVPVVGLATWWRNSVHRSWHWANERWFQEDTYAGGADKASHMLFGYIGAEAARAAYKSIGKSDEQARLLSTGLVTLCGLVVEVGDGFTGYGFSWEDAVSDLAGAVISNGIAKYGLTDTLGMRIGLVKALTPDPCCTQKGGAGDDYSQEIYTFDVKMAGLLPRMKVPAGPARFLLVSFAYNTKGYRYSLPEYRQRNVGVELALNMPEILRSVGVKDTSWWGGPLLSVLRYFRIPYTAFGWYYDLNHSAWHGPEWGNEFEPGP